MCSPSSGEACTRSNFFLFPLSVFLLYFPQAFRGHRKQTWVNDDDRLGPHFPLSSARIVCVMYVVFSLIYIFMSDCFPFVIRIVVPLDGFHVSDKDVALRRIGAFDLLRMLLKP